MAKEINPVTRTRLWYIAAFLLIDSIVALYASNLVDFGADPTLAWLAFAVGSGSFVGAGCIAAFLVATSKPVTDKLQEMDL